MIKDLLEDTRYSEDGKKRLLTHWLNNDFTFANKEEVDGLVTNLKSKDDDDFYCAALKRVEKETTS